ncbi:MAG TPA: hypothetical protein VEU62_01540 [Bryobacterales bacterium]|nr:hypothetical protein [Bryobacterales bacterium]
MGALCFLFALTPAWAQDGGSGPETFSGLNDRFRYYLHRTYACPERTIFLLADSGLGQMLNDPAEWGQGPETLGYRIASNLGHRIVANSIEFGLGAALREDARYRSPHLRGLGERVRYAAKAAFTARREGAGAEFAFARLGATAGEVLIGSLWQPRPVSAPDLLAGIGFGMLGRVPDNLLTEFNPDMRRAGGRILRRLRSRPGSF